VCVCVSVCVCVCVCACVFMVLWFELRTQPLSQVFFAMGFFEIGSHELFGWAGFVL
jgi:hypothetical protein